MHITWHGLSCVKLQTHGRSEDAQLLINPYQDSTGLQMPKLKIDIAAVTDPTNEWCNNTDRLQGEPFLITHPGEYEVKEIFIYGVPDINNRVLYVIEAEGIKLGHLNTELKELTEEQLKLIEGVDVLFLPLTTENPKLYSSVVSQVEPRIVIPILYHTPKVKAKLNTIDAFLKEFGAKNVQPENKIILKQKDLPVDETKVVVLNVA